MAAPLIRRATPADAAAYARIMGDPAVFPGLMQLPWTSEHLWRQRLEQSCALTQQDHLLLVAERDGQIVGTSGLHPAGSTLRRRHVWMLGISVLAAAHRQGVGAALMSAMLDWADGWAGALRIELDVFADNAPAIALYRRFGFVHEGTHRAYALRDGRYVDSLSMARLHPSPPALPGVS